MAIQIVPQGTLNRLRGSVVFDQFPNLNVTPPFLGKPMIRLAFEGQSTLMIDTATGLVTSPEPYIKINVTMALLKTQSLSDQYKQQWESNAVLGDATIRPDSTPLSPFQISNTSILSVGELAFDGTTPDYMVTISGIYYLNSALWN